MATSLVMRTSIGLLLLFTVLNGVAGDSLRVCGNNGDKQYDFGSRAPEAVAAAVTTAARVTVAADTSAWMDLLARKIRGSASAEDAAPRKFAWAELYRSMTLASHRPDAAAAAPRFLSEVPLQDVRLDPDSMYLAAQQTNLQYLVSLDADRLVWSFRKQAQLPTVGQPYGGWEAPDYQLRGHFVGHYLSAAAKTWASTNNDTIRQKMSRVVDALYDCQKKMGTGYLSAFPTSFFDIYENLDPIQAPYYTIHKIMQGLLDQHTVAGNPKALGMAVWMAEYFGERVKNVIQMYSIKRHWRAMNMETGGMNDVLYQLYDVTRDLKHLTLAHLFDKPCFLGSLALKDDDIASMHANTHLAILVGAQQRYEIAGDPLYKDIAMFFMDTVNASHTFVTGATSTNELWHYPNRLGTELTDVRTAQTSATYSMLKIARSLFRWTKAVEYADYYEKALVNGIMGSQRSASQPGVMLYFIPVGPGQTKAVIPPPPFFAWGTPTASFWASYGTGVESFAKLGDSIYFEDKGQIPGLYVIQYILSTLNWRSAGLTVKQQVNPLFSTDSHLQVSLAISATGGGRQATVNVRIPSWSSAAPTATLNGQRLNPNSAAGYISITNNWDANDLLVIQFPIKLTIEQIKDERPQFANVQAALFGPYVLAGLTPQDWFANVGDATAIPQSRNAQLVSLTQASGRKTFVLSIVTGRLTMEALPGVDGTDESVHATFRVDPGLQAKGATIEPFALPGMAVTNGLDVGLPGPGSLFNAVRGLDGAPHSVSFELATRPGCFLATAASYNAGEKVQVGCGGEAAFHQAASFVPAPPLRQYHPLSFAATGAARSFLLEPLLNVKDEHYTVYFNTTRI